MSIEEIEKIYNKYLFPSQSKLMQLLKKEGIKVSSKDVEKFLKKQAVEQVFSDKNKRKKTMGSIVAFYPMERIQIDLIDMMKFKGNNKNFSYIMCFVDVFTRRAWAYLIKNKNVNDIYNALEKFFEKHNEEKRIKKYNL